MTTQVASAPAVQRKTKVLFVFRNNRRKRMEFVLAAEAPDDMLYGLRHFDERAYAVDTVKEVKPWWRVFKFLFDPIENYLTRTVDMGFRFFLTLGSLKAMREADVVISTMDPRGLPIAMLKSWGWLRTPLIYISQGLSDRMHTLEGRPAYRAILTRYSQWLRAADRVLTLGKGAREDFVQTFGVDPARVHYMPFGIDHRFWTPAETPATGDYVLSVGSDAGRDYKTLFEAQTARPLKVVSMMNLSRFTKGSNVEHLSDMSYKDLRELYRNARFVVVPLRDIFQPSGQSVTLQAMACGKPVLMTHIKGLWDPEVLKHGENFVGVAPYDAKALHDAIELLWNDATLRQKLAQNGRRLAETLYTSAHVAADLSAHIDAVHAAAQNGKR